MGNAEKNCSANSDNAITEIDALIADIRALAAERGWTERTTCVKVFNNSRLIDGLKNHSEAIRVTRQKLAAFITSDTQTSKSGKSKRRRDTAT